MTTIGINLGVDRMGCLGIGLPPSLLQIILPMKPKLVMLHGALGAQSQLKRLKQELEKTFEVLSFDFEGHGMRKAKDRPFRIQHFAENLEDFLDAHDLKDARIFGYSMGGYVALHLASKRKDLIGSIFTLATKFDWNPETSAKEIKMLDPEGILAKVPKYAETLQRRHQGLDWKEHLRMTADLMVNLGDHPLLDSETLSQIDIPVRVGLGDRDTMVSLEETQEVYKALPKGELMVIPKTPHPIEKVDLKTLGTAVAQFFTEEV